MLKALLVVGNPPLNILATAMLRLKLKVNTSWSFSVSDVDIDQGELVVFFVDFARIETNVPPVNLLQQSIRAIQLLERAKVIERHLDAEGCAFEIQRREVREALVRGVSSDMLNPADILQYIPVTALAVDPDGSNYRKPSHRPG